MNTTLFPYNSFPVRLEFSEDGKNTTICFFECEEHLQKYLSRYKLDKRTIKIDYKDGKPDKPSKTNKAKVRQGTEKDNNGSTSRNRGGTKSVDSPRNSNRTRKSK